jgi:hypothetical protein
MKTSNNILPRVLQATLVCFLSLHSLAFSQRSATNQVITLQVAELNALSVSSQVVSLNFAPVGREHNAATKLIWTSNGEDRKITVARREVPAGRPIYIALKPFAQDAGFEKDIELSNSTTLDLLHGLSRSAGGCVIEFSIRSADDRMSTGAQQAVIYTITSG